MADRRWGIDFDLDNMRPAAVGATPKTLWLTSAGIMIAYGTSVPSDGTSGYVPGALFFKTDGTVYINTSTAASAAFKTFSDAGISGTENADITIEATGTGDLTLKVADGGIAIDGIPEEAAGLGVGVLYLDDGALKMSTD